MTDARLLLCADMDRTAIPNGLQPEHPDARKRFAALCARPDVTLAYVTGRHKELVQDAIREWNLPEPDYAVTDVGTVIYRVAHGAWKERPEWAAEIGKDWKGKARADLLAVLGELPHVRLQEPEKQNPHKVSFYLSDAENADAVMRQMRERLDGAAVEAELIWSVDETEHVGLLDVLPRHATKRHAVEFLRQHLGYAPSEVVFAGDSGNDLSVMESAVPSVLVANATDEVKRRARELAEQSGHPSRLYIASGRYMDMNGYYAAGILEGIWHFMPAWRSMLEEGETI